MGGDSEGYNAQIGTFVGELAGSLVPMPGHPENGPQYLVVALYQVQTWRTNSPYSYLGLNTFKVYQR